MPRHPHSDDQAPGSAAEEADVAVAETLGEHKERPLVRVLGAASEIADQAPAFATCGGVLLLGLVTDRPRLAEAGARMLAATLVATALKSVVKGLVSRTRPDAVLEGAAYEFRVDGEDGPDDHSFPSGHTANAVAAARTLARAMPDAALPAYATAAAIALVQLPRAKHYPIDLAAGALVGIVAEAIVAAAASAVGRRVPNGPPPADLAGMATDAR